ncbi:ABC transporter substrate-binding protein [Phormidium tenue FACHB-886]|nr:ABC transporter substrate-binding protein [Phormidium tenue FACHB-886]
MQSVDFSGGIRLRAIASSIALVLLTAGLAACQQAAPAPPAPDPSQTRLKLGAVLPATGALATASEPILEVLPLITNTVNACGGVNGLPIDLVVKDDQANPKTGTTAMTQLAKQDRVSAVLGNFANDAVAAAAMKVAVQNRIPVISPNNTSPTFTSRAQKGEYQGYWARTIPSETQQAIALAQLAKQRGLKQVSTLVSNDTNGIAFEKAFVAEFEKLGGKVLNKTNPSRYDPQSELDYGALSAFLPNGELPDGVIAAIDRRQGSQLLQVAYAEGLAGDVQVLLTNKARNASFVETVGQSVDGKFFLNGAIGTSPTVKSPTSDSFYKLWQEKQGSTPGLQVPQAWDALALLILAAQAAQSNQGKALKDQLRPVANPPGEEVTDLCQAIQLLKQGKDIDYEGVSGTVDLDKNGDVIANYEVWMVDEQGRIQTINQVELER